MCHDRSGKNLNVEISIKKKSLQYEWQNGVSTNNALAGDFMPFYDGTGDCQSMEKDMGGRYNDITCDATTAYSCGKYAA